MSRGLGYLPDPPFRAASYRLATFAPSAYPLRGSLAQHRPAVLDQGSTASCVGHGTSTLLAIAAGAWGIQLPIASPRALYRDARAIARRSDSIPLTDDGTYPSAVVDAMEYCGIYPLGSTESDVHPGNVNDEATLTELAVQRSRLIASPTSLALYDYTSLADMVRERIVARKEPIGLGILIGPEWSDWNGRGLIPQPFEGAPLGGHWIACDGYEMQRDTVVLKGLNSWGTSWGDSGEWRVSLREIFDSGRLLQALSFGPPTLLA